MSNCINFAVFARDSLPSCVLQGAEILSQSSRLEAEDDANNSDSDKSLPEDSASDSDNVCNTVLVSSSTLLYIHGGLMIVMVIIIIIMILPY